MRNYLMFGLWLVIMFLAAFAVLMLTGSRLLAGLVCLGCFFLLPLAAQPPR